MHFVIMSGSEKLRQPVEDEQPLEEEDAYDSRPQINARPTVPPLNKAPSRCFNTLMIVVYFVLFIMAVVALGTFGYKESQFRSLASKYGYPDQSCIL